MVFVFVFCGFFFCFGPGMASGPRATRETRGGPWAPAPKATSPVGPLIAAARHLKLLYNIIAAVVGFLAAVICFFVVRLYLGTTRPP